MIVKLIKKPGFEKGWLVDIWIGMSRKSMKCVGALHFEQEMELILFLEIIKRAPTTLVKVSIEEKV